MSYMITRTKIYKLIRRCRQTGDGFYWCPVVRFLLDIEGPYVDTYYYPRELFIKKMYYSEYDLDMFMSKEEMDVNESEYWNDEEMFYDTNKELTSFEVYDNVVGQKFSIGELVDNYEFVKNNRSNK